MPSRVYFSQMSETWVSNNSTEAGVKPSGMGILKTREHDVQSGMLAKLPDNVKPDLGSDGMVGCPWDTEKSKLSIIKATVRSD
jgi:hypothetical protein